MPRPRIIKLLVLTGLVATMITITRYSSYLSEHFGHLVPQRLIEYHQNQDLNHLAHLNKNKNSNSTSIDDSELVESSLIDKIVRIDARIDDSNKIQTSESSLKSSSPQSSFIVESTNSGDISSRNNSIINLESVLSVIKSINGKTSATIESTVGITLKEQEIKNSNTEDNENEKKVETKTENNNEFKIDTKDINKNDIKNDVNINVDQKSNETDNQNIQITYDNENNYSKATIEPKLVFDAEDLKTTESMKIDKPLACGAYLGASIDLLVIVISAVDHIEARNVIRKTWGKFAIERGAYLLFLVGNTLNNDLQRKILAEDAQHNDILQGRYIDNHFNLTLKTISMMKWIGEKCYKVKYVLKIDDDMFVNMQHIVNFCKTRSFSKVIIGKLAKKWKPHRETSNKWYVPHSAFNGTIFPDFATGPAYILSGDAAKPLYETSIKLTPLYLEDVYVTGIVAEKASIRRQNHEMMKNVKVKVDACNFRKLMTSHKHKPGDIIKLWKLVYNQPSRPCDTKNSKNSKNSKNVKKSTVPSNSVKSASKTMTSFNTLVATAG